MKSSFWLFFTAIPTLGLGLLVGWVFIAVPLRFFPDSPVPVYYPAALYLIWCASFMSHLMWFFFEMDNAYTRFWVRLYNNLFKIR